MTETCARDLKKRQVIRHKAADLPLNWQIQMDSVAQFPVKVDSSEYKEILALFDKTMRNKYTDIVYLYRIQNKQWYMQFNTYKQFSPKQNTERKLFHGCKEESTKLIINSFFNRSFAGIHGQSSMLHRMMNVVLFSSGISYGQGAYFSAHAVYSHDFTRPNASTGERHMFVASVIVGDSALGNNKMKTPPAGYDSTTNGSHIFVTYRDDQAYAEYLIVYK